MPTRGDEFYLGDGLYAHASGFDVRLRAPREDCDHVVYLDPQMLQRLIDYARENGMQLR